MTADTVGRVIKRVAAGTASTSNQFADEHALTSGAFQLALTSDLNWLGEESTYRQLASIPGFTDVSRQGPTGNTTNLQPSDFDWLAPNSAAYSPAAACACLGTHAIHRVATATTTWPRATLRARVEPPPVGADKLGYILVASPGRSGNPNVGTFTAGTIAGGGGVWVDLDVSVNLTAEMTAGVAETPSLGNGGSSGVSTIGEPVVIDACTFWCSFFSTAGKCQVVAITLTLEPVP